MRLAREYFPSAWEPVAEQVAREVSGEEKATWWSVARQVWPAYDDNQAATERVIPLFVLERA